MVGGFSKAEPWIDGDPLDLDAGRHGRCRPRPEEVADLFHNRGVRRMVLHRRRGSLHVHEDETGLRLGHRIRHFRIMPQCTNVVDDRRTGVQRPPRHFRLRRIHRDGNPDPTGQGCEHRQDTGQLNVQWNWLGAGARRLAPEVQQIGSFRFDLLGPCNGRLNAEIAPAIGERVRGDVQHPHDQHPFLQREGIPPRPPVRWRRGEVHRQQAYGL